MITDGQVHDVPAAPPVGAPIHALITGEEGSATGASPKSTFRHRRQAA
jgi:hypothetical protein